MAFYEEATPTGLGHGLGTAFYEEATPTGLGRGLGMAFYEEATPTGLGRAFDDEFLRIFMAKAERVIVAGNPTLKHGVNKHVATQLV